jgi:hypothetical protein
MRTYEIAPGSSTLEALRESGAHFGKVAIRL